jgi:RimJ/RimL family protein N-acetyltransferase
MKICFEKVAHEHINIIFTWLGEPFVMEFWDNTQAHKDDIINFVEGRKKPSYYAEGNYVYWIAKAGNEPFAMLMSIQDTDEDDIAAVKWERLSKTGNTWSIDYMIGHSDYHGKGYGARTLSEFIDFFRARVDPRADTFFIDPAVDNLRAKHVYMKAGFEHVTDFIMEGDYSGSGKRHHLLVRDFSPK